MVFFTAKKSTPESVDVASGGDGHRREESFEPIQTTVDRKLPYLEPFELCAFTVREAHRKEIVRLSPALFSERFHDPSTQNLLLLIECHRSQCVSLQSQTLRKSLVFSLFSKAIAFDFFSTKKSTPESVCGSQAADRHRREKSHKPIRTTLGRKLTHLERLEPSALTMPEAHRQQIVQLSRASFSDLFRDRSTKNLLLRIERHRSL